MNRLILVFLMLASPALAQDATVYVMPQIPTEAEKVEALKLAYELNGNSMVRRLELGNIDLSGPKDPIWPEPLSKADKPKDRKRP